MKVLRWLLQYVHGIKNILGCCKTWGSIYGCFNFRNKKGLRLSNNKKSNVHVLCKIYKY